MTHLSDPLTCFDFRAGYRGRKTTPGGFSYRGHLNIRNLLNANGSFPVGALPSGVVCPSATIDSRTNITTFAADFQAGPTNPEIIISI